MLLDRNPFIWPVRCEGVNQANDFLRERHLLKDEKITHVANPVGAMYEPVNVQLTQHWTESQNVLEAIGIVQNNTFYFCR
jgi:hypothetical protein